MTNGQDFIEFRHTLPYVDLGSEQCNSEIRDCNYSARHLNPTKSNSNGNLTDLVFRFFPRISTDLHGFLLISTDFHEFSRFSVEIRGNPWKSVENRENS